MASDMSREAAYEVIIEAASKWQNELAEFCIPDAYDEEDAQGYQDEYDRISEAFDVLRKEGALDGR